MTYVLKMADGSTRDYSDKARVSFNDRSGNLMIFEGGTIHTFSDIAWLELEQTQKQNRVYTM